MGKEATDKFRSNETSRLPMSSFTPMSYKDYDYGEGAWSDQYRSQVDKINQENRAKVEEYNKSQQQGTDQYNKSISDYLSSIPSVLKGAFSFTDRPKPTSERISFGTVSKSNAQPNMSYAPNMSVAPKPAPQMSFARPTPSQSVIKPELMSMAQPQINFNRQAPTKPTMSMAQPTMMSTPIAPIRPTPPRPTPPRPTPPRPTLNDYLRMGKTVAQWFAETGQQSSLDSLSSKGYDPRTNANPYDMSGKQMSVDPKQVVNQSIQAASQGYQYVSPSGNVIPNYTPANANMTDASTGLPVVANNAPYPIMTMADGRIKYSDGSIR
jgi:hypothetical protein